MTVKEQLKAALELFGPNGENWVKRDFSETRHCIILACQVKNAPTYILRTQLDNMGRGRSLTGYNDDPTTTFEDVRNLFERAIEAAS